MARIPESEIEQLKREVALERLVEAKGIALARHGANLVGRCPFHEDRTPSLVVTPAKNLWHCLGACQAGGSVIDWVMRTEGVSFRHAVELLREGSPALAAAGIVKRSTVPKLAAPVSIGADDQQLLNQVVDFYHATLKAAPEALRYLQRRGLVHPELIDRFRLGFANRSLGVRLPANNRKTGAVLRGRLTKVGILRDSGHEHFSGCMVVPIVDEAGNVLEAYGRKITVGLKPGLPLHLYLPGPHRGVWNGEALAAAKEIIVCEALIDAMTFWCAGFRNVTAAYGVEGFTEDMLAAFKRHGTERVLIAYDRDEAGERAAEKLAAKLIAEGMECWRIQFPKGMDANSYALKVQPATKSLAVAIRKALWLGKGKEPERPVLEPVQSAPAPVVAAEPLDHARARAHASSSLAAVLAAKEKTEPTPDPRVEHVSAAPPPSEDEPLAASPVPPAPSAEIAAELKENEIVLALGDRRYRVRGLAKNLSLELLKVNVLASRGDAFHVDTIDLYSAKQRAAYIAQAASELRLKDDVVKADVGRLLLKLEELQEQAIRKATEPKLPAAVRIEETAREAALEFLRSGDLIARVAADLEACGLVGEKTNKLVAYLAAVSRKLDQPLAVLVQSSSAAGKSTLMEAVIALVPEEDRVKYSAMTGQSLFYLGTQDLKHKVLAIAEEEGAARAAYALKLLSSEGELTIASTGKDPATGNLVTQEYRVEGPVMLFTTTTAMEIDEELKNRCLVLGVDESREQTQAIHRVQRDKRTLDGLARKARRAELHELHRNAQRLLRPLEVLNPYAHGLTFPDQATRTRRDHEKYLTLIDTIALLHQHQREVRALEREGERIEYIEATLADIALANDLAHEVLGRSLDELPPQTRRLLQLTERHVRAECKRLVMARAAYRFSRRGLREAIRWGDTQLKLHLARLVDLEYLVAHRAAHGAHEYELLYDGAGEDGRPFVPGLIDVKALGLAYDSQRSGVTPERSAPGRGAVGPWSGGGRVGEIGEDARESDLSGESVRETAKTRFLDDDAEKLVVPLAAARRA